MKEKQKRKKGVKMCKKGWPRKKEGKSTAGVN